MAAIQRRCKKIESRLSLNQPLVVDGTGTLLDIYVYQSYQLENIEIKEFRDGLTVMEHMVLKYLLQERDMPVGNTLPDMVITIILCLIAGKLIPEKNQKE